MTKVQPPREVKSPNITLGGSNPILVQTMLKGHFYKYNTCYINALKYRGCDVLRFSINGDYDKETLAAFIRTSPLPLVLDVKSTKQQALDALSAGIDAVRINPALLNKSDTLDIFRSAKDQGAIVRIGTNEGSTHGRIAITLIHDAIELAESINFKNIVTSIKASDSEATLTLNRKLARETAYPIHIGLTEAGGEVTSAVRSTLVISTLLNAGIGSTIRYSMAASEKKEVEAGSELLSSLALRKQHLNLIVCPSCARCTFLTEKFLSEIEDDLYEAAYNNNRYISVAIMGCSLNGIGEAKTADYGISGDGITAVIFKKGAVIEKTSMENARFILLRALLTP